MMTACRSVALGLIVLGSVVGVGRAAGGAELGASRARPRELVVFEAASLKDVFTALARRFQADNEGATVIANAAGSQELRAQIEQGAAADLFASADRNQMDALVAKGLALSPVVFTCNDPVVVVRRELAPEINSLADLPKAERIVLGATAAPIGSYSAQILHKAASKLGADFPARVEAKVVSRDLNVRQVLAKVVLGEADAAIVYRSDAVSARDKVRVVEIPTELNVTAEYSIAILRSAREAALARRWLDLVRSPAAVQTLHAAGFAPCPAR